MQYLLDTNTFIEAKNDYYRFSFCPGYWDWLLQKNQEEIIYCVDKIKAELLAGNDDLTEWTKKSPDKLFIKPTANLGQSLALVSQWTNSRNFTDAAKTVFFNSADYYLIAYAHSLSYTLVTRERSDPNSRRRVKIPDACLGVGVRYISPFELMEIEKANLVCN